MYYERVPEDLETAEETIQWVRDKIEGATYYDPLVASWLQLKARFPEYTEEEHLLALAYTALRRLEITRKELLECVECNAKPAIK